MVKWLKCCIFSILALLYGCNNKEVADSDVQFGTTGDLSIRFQHIEPVVHSAGLVGYWPFNEGSGYTCLDWSGHQLTGYLTGSEWNTTNSGLTSSFRKRGKRAGCLYMDGTQWVQVQQSEYLQLTGDYAISLWIHPEELTNVELLHCINETISFIVSLENDGTFSFGFAESDSVLRKVHSGNDVIVPGKWQHLIVSYSEDQGKISLFFNGDSITANGSDIAVTLKDHAVTVTGIPTTREQETIRLDDSGDLYIGGSNTATKCFIGLIDDVALFNRSVKSDEAHQLYTNGLPEIYTQNRETIDAHSETWNVFHGNDPVPHPAEENTELILRFDGHPNSIQGDRPENAPRMMYSPGVFGGAWSSAASGSGIKYRSPLRGGSGCVESWVQLTEQASKNTPLFKLMGEDVSLELTASKRILEIVVADKHTVLDSFVISDISLPAGQLVHLAVSWHIIEKGSLISVYVNGVQKGSKQLQVALKPDDELWIGGDADTSFNGLIDDVRISSVAKTWGEICPRGQMHTESPALDLMLGFDDIDIEAIMHWSGTSGNWNYSTKEWDRPGMKRCIEQTDNTGLHRLYHPDAFGMNSSFEAVLSADSLDEGWAGVFVQSPEPADSLFSGHVFMMNLSRNQIKIATIRKGIIIRDKTLDNDFTFEPQRLYTLTLTSVNGLLRGFLDQRNVISLETNSEIQKGYAGLITLNRKIYFDDIHFTALTPPTEESRKIEVRTIANNDKLIVRKFSFNAFRWKKRYGLLPWHRDYKDPEPPGNIFGPDQRTERPNPSADWRSEDAANSSVIHVNGTFFYFMRGNPDVNGKHGNARIGVLWADDKDFDGLHFTDPTLNKSEKNSIRVLRGHEDTNQGNCSDEPPRDERFQLNDEGTVYFEGKIIMVCREFRNSNESSNRFKRLVMGIYDVSERTWVSEEPFLMDWSSMNPDSCYARLNGINATPEVSLLRDPETDEYIILLYHDPIKKRASRDEMQLHSYRSVSGFYLDGHRLKKHQKYPEHRGVQKPGKVSIYGERVLFDNGIWYLHINAHRDGLKRDWPDRFELFTSQDPYAGTWQPSRDNNLPYFERGGEFDPDNGAIWQGDMLKYRNHYYMYYENYHVIDNTEVLYEYYDHAQSGSRVGYAVAN